MSLNETLVLLAVGVLLSAFCLWHQRRPRGLGEVSLFPSTLLLGTGLLAIVLALAHIVTLWTGHAPGRQLW